MNELLLALFTYPVLLFIANQIIGKMAWADIHPVSLVVFAKEEFEIRLIWEEDMCAGCLRWTSVEVDPAGVATTGRGVYVVGHGSQISNNVLLTNKLYCHFLPIDKNIYSIYLETTI